MLKFTQLNKFFVFISETISVCLFEKRPVKGALLYKIHFLAGGVPRNKILQIPMNNAYNLYNISLSTCSSMHCVQSSHNISLLDKHC